MIYKTLLPFGLFGPFGPLEIVWDTPVIVKDRLLRTTTASVPFPVPHRRSPGLISSRLGAPSPRSARRANPASRDGADQAPRRAPSAPHLLACCPPPAAEPPAPSLRRRQRKWPLHTDQAWGVPRHRAVLLHWVNQVEFICWPDYCWYDMTYLWFCDLWSIGHTIFCFGGNKKQSRETSEKPKTSLICELGLERVWSGHLLWTYTDNFVCTFLTLTCSLRLSTVSLWQVTSESTSAFWLPFFFNNPTWSANYNIKIVANVFKT